MIYWLIRLLIKWCNKITNLLRKSLVFFAPNIVRVKLSDTEIKLDNRGKDGLTAALIISEGDWEREELKLFSALAVHAKTILDIGSNVGVYSVLAGKLNHTAEIFAFEPSPGNIKRLKSNLELNHISNCKVCEVAVGDVNKKISFYVPTNDASTSVSSVSEAFTGSWHKDLKKVEVEQISLDSYIPTITNSKIDLIKMDVEYYEMPVLLGAKELLLTHKPSILCEVNIYEILSHYLPSMKEKIDKDVSYQIETFFKEIGYSIYSLGLDGIMRVDTLHIHPDQRNFLFSSLKTKELFTTYADIIERSVFI